MEQAPERRPPNRGIQVKLLGHSPDPIRSLYLAYRTAYSALTPLQIDARIADERITREQMLDFIEKRLQTGHASPLEQVWFEFAIAGVTRAFSHQFVRHHMGISFEQQSQRYVTFKGGEFPYTVPETVKRAGLDTELEDEFERLAALYDRLVQAGVPAEDARFVLPNATNTNFKVTVNFLEFLHIADLRLCTRAQWEFRKVVSLMRRAILEPFPQLGSYLQPKCGEHRLGYCDESYDDWRACPIGKKRPHKTALFQGYELFRERFEQSRAMRTSKVEADQIQLFDASEFVDENAQRRANLFFEHYIPVEVLSEDDFVAIESEDSSTGR